MRFILVIVVLLSAAIQAQANCGWRDGMDTAAPANDPGRGVTDWRKHFDHVASGRGLADAHRLVAERFVSLRGCLPRGAYGRLYADVSVLIANVGRERAGWRNAMDTSAPSDDPGRGIAQWQPHYDHVASGRGEASVNRLIGERLGSLSKTLDQEAYSRLYADLSIILANYARMD